MDIALWHKFYQHRDLRAELLDTGNAELVEVRVHGFVLKQMMSLLFSRTLIKMHSGVSVTTEGGAMNLARHWKGCERSCGLEPDRAIVPRFIHLILFSFIFLFQSL